MRSTAFCVCGAALVVLAWAAQPARAENGGERIGAALNRGAQASECAAERAGAATGAAADRSPAWTRREVRGEGGGGARKAGSRAGER